MKTDVSAYGVTELSPDESSSTAGGFWPIVAIIAGVGAIIGAATGVGVVIGVLR